MKEFKSLAHFEKFLANIVSKDKLHLSSMLEVMGKHIEEDAKRKFGIYQGQAGHFNSWQPLAEATKEDRIRKGFEPDNPLYRTGNLMNSIYTKVDPVFLKAAVGSDEDIMVWQELGTPDSKHPIPPRPVLGPAAFESKRELQKIALSAIASWLTGKLPIRPKY